MKINFMKEVLLFPLIDIQLKQVGYYCAFMYEFVFNFIVLQTGGDGCICYLEYDRDRQSLEFLGMKQVKELSLVRCLFDSTFSDDSSSNYAIGFSSTNFLIWNLMTEAKVTPSSVSLFLPTYLSRIP